MMKVTSKNGSPVTDEEENKPKKKFPSLNLKDKNIVQTYYWAFDLRGRLKRDIRPPGYYHGLPRPFVQEDIEENDEDNTLTSYLRVYIGRDLKAQTSVTYPLLSPTFLGSEVAESDIVRRNVLFLLTQEGKHYGWEFFTGEPIDFRKKKSTKAKSKRLKAKPKNIIKKVVKKVVRKKRK